MAIHFGMAAMTSTPPPELRDPHLPPPEVCEWLLQQDWSEAIPITTLGFHGLSPHGIAKSKLYEYRHSHTGIGADEGGRILLPVEALDVLRKDRDDRRAAINRKRQAGVADELTRKARREQQRCSEAELRL